MPVLERISVTPVKGTALRHLPAATLTAAGIAGNRRFHLIDDVGRLRSGDSHGRLVQVRTEVDEGTGWLRCRFPDGSVAEGPTDDTQEAVRTDFYGRLVEGAVLGGPFGAAFSAFLETPVRLVRIDRDGDGPDVHHLSLVSFASVAELGRRGGHEGELDARRFRMNLELGGMQPHEEDTWDGREVRIGDAVITVFGQVPRCRFTTLSPDTGEKDFDTLREIVRYRPFIEADGRGIPFGMYAEVVAPGKVAVGDAVGPL
jgi:uncharacterized protein YcbX